MTIPKVGDGQYLGHGNTNETLVVGKGAQPVRIGDTSSALVGFYGKTPVVQRTYVASVHNTTALASSTAFAAAQTAIVAELMNTMIALGVYPTA